MSSGIPHLIIFIGLESSPGEEILSLIHSSHIGSPLTQLLKKWVGRISRIRWNQTEANKIFLVSLIKMSKVESAPKTRKVFR